MCTTCGCGEGEVHIEGDAHSSSHIHSHGHDHGHAHGHAHTHDEQPRVVHHHYHHQGDVHHHYHIHASGSAHLPIPEATTPAIAAGSAFKPQVNAQGDLHYGQDEAQTHAPGMSQKRLVEIEMNVLDKNNRIAAHNREHFLAQNILALNLVSSPGSGKTTLLTETLKRIQTQHACAVIEGDQQTSNDADRIRETGVPAIQVNTGKGCHLDAQMVHDAAHRLGLKDDSILFIENVGNLVCPSGFDLGEKCKVLVISVTEGDDKPLKYPHMTAASSLMVINKIDLLSHVKFSVEKCIENARRVNPKIQVIEVSATSGQGMEEWLGWLENELTGKKTG